MFKQQQTDCCHSQVPQHYIAIDILFNYDVKWKDYVASVIDEWMCMEHQLNDTGRNSYCHFVHHKSHMNWPGIEPGPVQWEVGNSLPEPWHGPPAHLVPLRRHKKCTWPLTNSQWNTGTCVSGFEIMQSREDTETASWLNLVPSDSRELSEQQNVKTVGEFG